MQLLHLCYPIFFMLFWLILGDEVLETSNLKITVHKDQPYRNKTWSQISRRKTGVSKFERASNTLLYCERQCWDFKANKTMEKKEHTMCQFKGKNSKNCGNNTITMELSQYEKDFILLKFNRLRQRVAQGLENQGSPGPQPRASNMLELHWDTELEDIAVMWAIQCQSGNDKCRDVDRFRVSQSVGSIEAENMEYAGIIDKWYLEVKDFNETLVSHGIEFNGQSANYARIVGAKTGYMGCGLVVVAPPGVDLANKTMGEIKTKQTLVCNYGKLVEPMKTIYEIGAPCSNCPRGYECSMVLHGLCQDLHLKDKPKPDINEDAKDKEKKAQGNSSILTPDFFWIWFLSLVNLIWLI